MNIQWFPGHMAKAKNEIKEKLSLVDAVIILLDSRIPSSSLNPMLESILGNKPRVFLLTKSSLADNSKTILFQNKFPNCLAIDSVYGFNIKKIHQKVNEVLKDKLEKEQKKGLKPRSIRVMIVGIPNVGKSTLINTLVNKKATNVGNKPGVTKSLQWVRIHKNIDLLDTPGILWPKFEDKTVAMHLALTGAIKSELIPTEDLTFYLLDFLRTNYPLLLSSKYEVDISLDNISLLNAIITKYGLKKEDYERCYEIILNDFRNGRIGKITLDYV